MPVNPMRPALWIFQILGIYYLVKTAGLGKGWFTASDQVGDHVRGAFLALLFTLSAHIGCLFYFIGTRRILRETKEALGFSAPEKLMKESEQVLKRFFPLMTTSAVALTIGFILGGAADTGAVSFSLHGTIALLAVTVNVIALGFEMWLTQKNHLILVGLRQEEAGHAAHSPSTTT